MNKVYNTSLYPQQPLYCILPFDSFYQLFILILFLSKFNFDFLILIIKLHVYKTWMGAPLPKFQYEYCAKRALTLLVHVMLLWKSMRPKNRACCHIVAHFVLWQNEEWQKENIAWWSAFHRSLKLWQYALFVTRCYTAATQVTWSLQGGWTKTSCPNTWGASNRWLVWPAKAQLV